MLSERTLIFDPTPGSTKVLYPYVKEVCAHPDRKIFRGCKNEKVVLSWDLANQEQKMELIKHGFVAVTIRRIQ